MESREFRTRPVQNWLFCFSETIEGLIQRMYFAVLLLDGMIVESKFAQRLKLRLPKSEYRSNRESHRGTGAAACKP
jgi:hypothetical protein